MPKAGFAGAVASERHIGAANARYVGDRIKRQADLLRQKRPSVMPLELVPTSLTAALGDYSILPSDEESANYVDTLVPFQEAQHYRVQLAESYATGHCEFCVISEGFLVHVSDVSYDLPYTQQVSASNILRVRIASDGDVQYSPQQGEKLDLIGPSAAIVIEPPGMPPAEAIFGGQNNRVLHVYISRDALQEMYEGGEQALPLCIRDFLAGQLDHTIAQRLALAPAMLRCLEDLRACPLEGRNRRLFIQSKAIEVLCYAFEALAHEEHRANPAAISPITTQGVLEARRLLNENFANPPSLNELARTVGISRSGLCNAFRQIVGQTIFDYIADLRMQHAIDMLQQTDVSITEIAHIVGFSQLSNFTIAMQRRLGSSPSELRRGNMASQKPEGRVEQPTR